MFPEVPPRSRDYGDVAGPPIRLESTAPGSPVGHQIRVGGGRLPCPSPGAAGSSLSKLDFDAVEPFLESGQAFLDRLDLAFKTP